MYYKKEFPKKPRVMRCIAAALIALIPVFFFSACGDPPFDVPLAVSIFDIQGVTIPATGETPVTKIDETTEYTGTVLWYPADSPFIDHEEYTAI
ncbi:MAG: hypothetical protein FWG46_08495, partial [Treponema sp.]|nr:hypothetical protein [Treponema sp.]